MSALNSSLYGPNDFCVTFFYYPGKVKRTLLVIKVQSLGNFLLPGQDQLWKKSETLKFSKKKIKKLIKIFFLVSGNETENNNS